MDIFERFNNKFGSWYEGLFGGSDNQLRPKDVLRKITAAMEDNRKEGLDNKIYVPNKYILELAIENSDERDYLLSFLDEEELAAVLKRFMSQNNYHTRGPLDFTISELDEAGRQGSREKLRVKARFEKESLLRKEEISDGKTLVPEKQTANDFAFAADDMPTVAAVNFINDEPGTVPAVAWASLAIISSTGKKSLYSLTRPETVIGRSRNAGNDLVLEDDGMVSKAHARIERERDGRFTIYDLNSTNGVAVNGARVGSNRVLKDQDEIKIGATVLTFQQDTENELRDLERKIENVQRPKLVDPAGRQHVLGSETLIGRAITSDIVLDFPGVATRHARIVSPQPQVCQIEALAEHAVTMVNNRPITPGISLSLADGDTITIGEITLLFIGGLG